MFDGNDTTINSDQRLAFRKREEATEIRSDQYVVHYRSAILDVSAHDLADRCAGCPANLEQVLLKIFPITFSNRQELRNDIEVLSTPDRSQKMEPVSTGSKSFKLGRVDGNRIVRSEKT